MSDVADRYAQLADGFLARIRATPAERWDAPSPCRGWTARDVVAHVINGHRGILTMVHGTAPAAADGVAVSPMADAPVVEPGAELTAAFTTCRNDMLGVLRDPGLASRPLPGGPLGPAPVEQSVDMKLRPERVLAGLLVREDLPAPGGGERVELPFELLPTGRDPGVSDLQVEIET